MYQVELIMEGQLVSDHKKEKIIGEKGSQNGTKVKKENLCSILRLQRLMKNIC